MSTTPIERAAEALLAPVHAPPEDHSKVDGSCTSCPWPLHQAESPESIARAVFASIDRERLADLLYRNLGKRPEAIADAIIAHLTGQTALGIRDGA